MCTGHKNIPGGENVQGVTWEQTSKPNLEAGQTLTDRVSELSTRINELLKHQSLDEKYAKRLTGALNILGNNPDASSIEAISEVVASMEQQLLGVQEGSSGTSVILRKGDK